MPSLSLCHLLLIALTACAIGAVVGLAKPAPAHAACTPLVGTNKMLGPSVQGEAWACPYPLQVCIQNNDGHGWSAPFNCRTGSNDVVTLVYQMTCGWAIYYRAMGRYNWGSWVYGASVTC
jgi:hypothetical protein